MRNIRDRADSEVHPVVTKALELFFYQDRRRFDEDAIEGLKFAICRICTRGDPDELRWMMTGIMRIARFLDEDVGCREGCIQLLEICAVALPTIKQLNEPVFLYLRDLQIKSNLRNFTNLTDKRDIREAPAFGQAAPANTVRLRALRPRRKIA